MANTQVRIRSPKGNVGVTDVVDAGELSAYSQGALSGFGATSAASFTIQIGGSSSVQDVAVGKNPAGESELFVGTSGTTIPFIIGGAPGTPGQSRTDALVLYKDPFTTSVVNNGLDVTDYAVVAGTPATTGTQVPPNDAAIRAAIPTGSLKFYCVIGYVTIAQGAGSVTTGNYYKNPALLHTQVVANATARAMIIPVEGMQVYQLDDDAKYVYTGSEWLAFDTKWQTYTPTLTNLTLGSGTSVGKYKRSGKDCEIDYVFTLGAGSAVGSNPEVTLPFNRVASGYGTDFLQPAIGNAVIVDEASAAYPGSVTTSQTKFRMYAHTASGTYTTLAAITATVPITFGSTDQLGARFKYQMA